MTNDAAARFWAKVNKTDGCWLWTGALTTAGYGSLTMGRKRYYAHRVSYTEHVGEIPAGTELDHLCRVRNCINPAHLEAVTHKVNQYRGKSPAAHNARKTHCIKGHPFSPENTYIFPGPAKRKCRICAAARERERRAHSKLRM